MLSVLNRRADTHPNHCEDNYFVFEDDSKVVGAVLDGCSTGNNSHWASQTFAYSLNKIRLETDNFSLFDHAPVRWEESTLEVVNRLRMDIRCSVNVLGLTDMELLTTVVLFVYDKVSKTLYVKFFGDGTIIYRDVDGFKYLTNDEENAPLYLSYFLNISDDEFGRYVSSRRTEILRGVDEFCICSDGIDSFVNLKDGKLDRRIPVRFLCEDSYLGHLSAGLGKKFNILANRNDDIKYSDDHYWWSIQDDLTIIRYNATV